MNIVKILTLRHLMANRRRTVITALGIFISSFMITAVLVGVASYLNLSAEMAIQNNGQWHAVFQGLMGTGITEEQIEMLKADDRIERVGCSITHDNKTDSYKIENAKSDRLGTGTFFAADENCINQMITGELEGSIPKNDNEIIVNREIIEKNDFDWKIGDTVRLCVGARTQEMSDYLPDFGFYYHNEYHTNEFFILDGIRKFKIVGILGDNPPTYSKGSIIRGLGEKDKENIAYIELKKVNPDSYKAIKEIAKSIGISIKEDEFYKYIDVNNDYLNARFAFTGNSNVTNIFSAAVIILVIITAASVVLIYNAFGMSLSERTRYLGMLASVGATRRQTKASVYFEGLILGAAAIPAGIGTGIIGVTIILKALGGKMIQSEFFLTAANLKMRTVVPLWAIIITIIISIITVLISSVIPAKRASAITPIEALRQSNEIKLNLKRLKTSFIVRKIFGFEGELANKNLKRNAGKARVITVSISLSAILFLSVNYFCEIYIQSNDLYNYYDKPYQVDVNLPSDEYEGAYEASYKVYENLKNSIMEIPSVKEVYSIENNVYTYSEKAANPKKGIDYTYINQDLRKPENLTSTYKNLWEDTELFVNFVEDDDFKELCLKNDIDYKRYYDKNSKDNSSVNCVVMNNISHKSTGNKVFTDNFIGEEIYYDNRLSPECDKDDNIIGWIDYSDEINESDIKKIIVTDFAEYDDNNYLCHLNTAGTISAYVPISMEKVFYADNIEMPISLGVVTDNHEYVAQRIGSILDAKNYTGSNVSDGQKYFEAEQSKIFVLQVFVYGFVILLMLITLANIVNTISTGINLRQREFAMLKSVGITQKGFIKLICLESLFYALRALVFAVPLSVVISYVLYKRIETNKIGFEINYLMYFAVIAVVFAVVGIAMRCSVSKLKKASVIETLKKDIC